MAPNLKHVFTTRIQPSKEGTHALGPKKGAAGPHRFIAEFAGGCMESTPECPVHPFKAKILGGADWLLHDTNTNLGRLDIRAQAKTEEGEIIYCQHNGLLRMDEATGKALHWSPDAKTTKSEDHYWVGAPIFEASSDRLKWMEQSIFLITAHWYVPGDGT